MYLNTNDYLITNNSILSGLPNYPTYFSSFTDCVSRIQKSSELQYTRRTGVALNKEKLKDNLISLTLDTSRKLTAYAKFSNNIVLNKEVTFTDSDLRRAADTILPEIARGLHNRAESNLTALTDYGVTAATQTALLTAITDYVSYIPKPRIAITEKKISTTELANLFKQADEILDNIDSLIDIISVTEPKFYDGYGSVRKVIDTGSSSLSVFGFVTDAATKLPIKDAIVRFSINNTESEEVIIKKTASKGGFRIKSMPNGVYSVKVSKDGYIDYDSKLSIIRGEHAMLMVELKKP
ncbi:MAG: carboxypeptidase-like regulatory domain-containing protein [Flavobacterium sp.]